MDGVLQKVISVLIAVVIFFILPLYIVYEKKDDISYALALKITTDFVENVNSKGYLTDDMYNDFIMDLAVTDNSYDIIMEHTSKKYNPVIYSYTDDKSTIRAKFDYNLYKDQYENNQIVINDGSMAGTYNNLVLAYDLSEKKYTQDQILSVINSTDKTVNTRGNLEAYKTLGYSNLPAISSIYNVGDSNPNNIYAMNKGDEFNVIVRNRNTTLASVIYGMVTFGVGERSSTKIYVNYGGVVKGEGYERNNVYDDTTNYNPADPDSESTASLVNSYVSTGLVLVLNGEFNGATIHSNDTNTWMDISGNGNNGTLVDFAFNDESGWRHNGLHFTGNEYVSLPNLDLDEMTVEVVCRLDTDNDPENTTLNIIGNQNYGGISLAYDTLNNVLPTRRGRFSFSVSNSDGTTSVLPAESTSSANKVYSVSGSFGKIGLTDNLVTDNMVYQTMVQLLSVNGEVTGMDYHQTYQKPATGSTFVIGGTPLVGAGANTEFKGTIYSIRIYNRALTEEEIKENYEIDKVKYGI